MENKNDFSQGNIYKHIMGLAIPMTIAQMVQVLYNIVDRIYIGHLQGSSSLALTGLGLTFPIVTIVAAFTNLFGMGGAPLCSIARGKNDMERAEVIMGNTFILLIISSFILMLSSYIFMKPLLYIFGASDITYPYAAEYLKIYLLGTPFIMLGTGMNGFINSQGFGKIATIISQLLSVIWVMKFLLGDKTILKLNKKSMKLESELSKNIMGLGLAGFVMSATNGAVQIACNATLKGHGGDVYIGIMTVLSSIRDVIMLPIHGVTTGAQPVLGYNYGAKKYDRIKKGIFFITIVTVIYMLIAWIVVFIFPENFIKVFSSDNELLVKGIPAMNIYYFGFFMMAFQVAGQSIFVALGQSKQAVFFSLFRKIIVVVPLTLFLPYVANLGVKGVF